MKKSEYLQEVLESSTKKHIESLMALHLDKKNNVREALQAEFGGKMVTNPINSGSYAKSTYINQKFDLDFCIPFKYSAFKTLREMSEAVYNFLRGYGDNEIVEVRHQKTSVGMIFRAYDKKTGKYHDLDIDVVPGRELSDGDYSQTTDLNLYVKPEAYEADSHIKTNIKEHIAYIKGKNDERLIIRLLKIFKLSANIEIKSFLIELLIIRFFEDNRPNIPSDLWEKLETALQFIADNIETITLYDPANSNNKVSDSLSEDEKTNFKRRIENVLSNIRNNSDDIKTYFPKSTVAVLGAAVFGSSAGASQLETNSFG